MEHVYNFNVLGLIINCHHDRNPHLNSIGIKIPRVIGLLRKLKYTLSLHVLQSHITHIVTYALHTFSHKIELLERKTLRNNPPIAHTEQWLKK